MNDELGKEVVETHENEMNDTAEPETCAEEADLEAEQGEQLVENPVEEATGEMTEGTVAKPVIRCAEQWNSVTESVQQLKQLFEKRLLIDEQKNKIIENQSRELEKYRDGLYEKILKPILCDVIGIADDLHRMVRAYRSKEEESIPTEKIINLLEGYEADTEEILVKYGIDIYSCEGESFEAIKQKAVKLIETPEEGMNRRIAERLSKGYSLNGKILQPEKVYAYKYVEPKVASADENTNEGMKEE